MRNRRNLDSSTLHLHNALLAIVYTTVPMHSHLSYNRAKPTAPSPSIPPYTPSHCSCSPLLNVQEVYHGTKSLENPITSRLQQTHVPKLFIAKLTLHSSHSDKHRQGQTSTERGEDWHTTQCGTPEEAAPRLSGLWAERVEAELVDE